MRGLFFALTLIHSNGPHGVLFAQAFVVVVSHPSPYGARSANSQQRCAFQAVFIVWRGVRLIEMSTVCLYSATDETRCAIGAMREPMPLYNNYNGV